MNLRVNINYFYSLLLFATLTGCVGSGGLLGTNLTEALPTASSTATASSVPSLSSSSASLSFSILKGQTTAAQSVTITNSFLLDTACATPINGATGAGGRVEATSGVIGITDAEMKALSTFNNFFGWNFTNTWSIVDGTSYPTLQWPVTDCTCYLGEKKQRSPLAYFK